MLSRAFSSSRPALSKKVAVIGAAGGIGQPLSLLLKMTPNISELALFDVVNTPGVAADIGHCSTAPKVSGYVGTDQLGDALKGCDVVVIPAGVPRKPGMTRDDLFNTNASIVQSLAKGVADHCPEACSLIISNPVNSTVPIFAETLKQAGVYDKRKVMGVTTLDVVRARAFVAENQGMDVSKLAVNVIGGHAGTTILPLLSQIQGAKFSDEDLKALTHRIQFGGDEVVKAKDGAGSATLSMAYAAMLFTDRLLVALNGGKGVVENCYVESTILPDTPYFSSPCTLGPNGVEEVHGFGPLSAFEQEGLDSMLPDLQKQAAKGVAFVNK